MARLDVNLTIVVDAVQLHRVGVDHVAVVLADVRSQVVFSVVPTVTNRTRPDFSFGMLRVNVSLQSLFVMKCLVAMHTLVVPQILMSVSHMSVQNLDRFVDCAT